MFPALTQQAWLDTPASAPGAVPVTAALTSAITGWQEGSLGAADWEAAAPRARTCFADYLGVPEAHVALMSSVAEAAATVAASLPGRGGTVVVGDGEFRSNLFPWLALAAKGYRVNRAPAGAASRTDSLLAAIDEETALLAVSHVLSVDGEHTDLVRLRAAADSVGARIFVDATQSLGVLDVGLAASRPDFLAVHGYKWLLCPRGAAWLVTPHYGELRPLLPSWKSAADGRPSESSARTSCSRAVSPAGAARVAARGPRGIARIPSSFIRRRAAAAVAPVAVLDAARIDRAHVLGASLGSMVGQELAITNPERVDGPVLACTTPGWPSGYPMPTASVRLIAATHRMTAEAALRPTPRTPSPRVPSRIVRNSSTAWWSSSASGCQMPERCRRRPPAGARYAGHRRHARIRARTLIMHGGADTVVDPRNARGCSRTASPMPGWRPSPSWVTCSSGKTPDGFADAVASFLLEPGAQD